MIGTLLIVIWGILTCISQYFLRWHTFAQGGLDIIGAIGLIGFVLWLFVGYYRHDHPDANWWI
jgi:hypothetical protein